MIRLFRFARDDVYENIEVKYKIIQQKDDQVGSSTADSDRRAGIDPSIRRIHNESLMERKSVEHFSVVDVSESAVLPARSDALITNSCHVSERDAIRVFSVCRLDS